MSNRLATIVAAVVSLIVFGFADFGLNTIALQVRHERVEHRLAEWPIHQGTVLKVGAIQFTPQWSQEWAKVGFKDTDGFRHDTSVFLPTYYRVGMTLPVRVNSSGPVFIPQAYYDGYYDPTKVLANGFIPVWPMVLGAILFAVGAFVIFLWLAAALESWSPGRLGSR